MKASPIFEENHLYQKKKNKTEKRQVSDKKDFIL